MSEALKLWFFRDLSDEQRLKLFGLFNLPIDEISNVHGRQAIALRHITLKLVEMARDATAAEAEHHATAARYKRLHDICARILWADLGVPATDNAKTAAALLELSEIMFMDALVAASTSAAKGGVHAKPD